MKKFVPLDEMFDRIRTEKVNSWFDKLTFYHIFFLWAAIIIIFGILYYIFNGSASHLLYTRTHEPVQSSADSIYFSFITATTTGFGDIIPVGAFKIIAIFEVISGLLLLAFVTSKLVSIKQDAILNEIYEISFNERINRLRSSMLLFRQNVNRAITRIEDGSMRKREVNEVYLNISALHDVLNEILLLIGKQRNSGYTKVIDALNAELLYNSVLQSFEKLYEMIGLMNERKLGWKRDVTLELIKDCIKLNEDIFSKLSSAGMSKKSITDSKSQKDKLTEMIKREMYDVKSKSYAEIQKTLKG